MAEDVKPRGIRLEITGAEQALAVLAAVLARTEDKKGLFDAVGAGLVVSTQGRFDKETGPDGQTWPASLRVKTFGGKTLTDSARLVTSLTHNATADGVEVGTNVIYAAIHQLGGTIRAKAGGTLRFQGGGGAWARVASVTMPARPFLGLDEDDSDEITALSDGWLGQALGAGISGSTGGADVR